MGTLGCIMKKLAKVLGLVGGAAAVVWAMRDRFISVATSREPEAPSFRTSAGEGSEHTIDTVDGIGPVFASRLTDAGLDTVSRLATASPDKVAEAAGVSAARARSWIEQAEALR
jgi:predicted flap endonuclease-1-like 5' DNA nuclease